MPYAADLRSVKPMKRWTLNTILLVVAFFLLEGAAAHITKLRDMDPRILDTVAMMIALWAAMSFDWFLTRERQTMPFWRYSLFKAVTLACVGGAWVAVLRTGWF